MDVFLVKYKPRARLLWPNNNRIIIYENLPLR